MKLLNAILHLNLSSFLLWFAFWKKSLEFSRCYGDCADVKNVFSGGLEKGTRWLQLMVSMAGCWCITKQGSAVQNCWAGCGWGESDWLQGGRACREAEAVSFPLVLCSLHALCVPTVTPHGCTGFNSCQLRCLSYVGLAHITLPVQLQLWGLFLSQEIMKYLSGTSVVLIFIDFYFLGGFSTQLL